jgi:hypothetical protein
MPPVPKPKKREQDRLNRKRSTAIQQASQFDDELSGHELNLARLDAIPAGSREANWQDTRDAILKAIATITNARDTTIAEAKNLGATDTDLGLDTAP